MKADFFFRARLRSSSIVRRRVVRSRSIERIFRSPPVFDCARPRATSQSPPPCEEFSESENHMRRTRVLVRTAIVIGALAVAFPSAARAGSITIASDFTGLQVHYEFNGVLAQPLSFGSVTMTGGTGLNDALNGVDFEAYCADIQTDVITPEASAITGVTYQADVAPMSSWQDPNGNVSPADGNRRAAYLYDRYVDPTSADALAAGDLEGRSALQLAIWNVLYDQDFSVATTNGGNFHVSLLKYDPDHPGEVIPVDASQVASYEAIALRADGFLSSVAGISQADLLN